MSHSLDLINIPGIDTGFQTETVTMIRRAQQDGELSGEVKFIISLPPQKEPELDKVRYATEEFRKYRTALKSSGLKVGILVLFILHGDRGITVGDEVKFPRCVDLDGNTTPRICPLGKNIRQYAYDSFRLLAQGEPDMLDMDEDIRFQRRRECFCQLHMERFNLVNDSNMTREELVQCLRHPSAQNQKIAAFWNQVQLDSLLDFARAARAGIDSVNPALECYNKLIASELDFALPVSQVLAGTEAPVIRINNGLYMVPQPDWVPIRMYHSAVQIYYSRRAGAKRIRSESDACRQHRFCTSASMHHTQITGSVIEGVDDVELRDMSPADFREPYRRVLIRNASFYRELAKLVRQLRWLGPSVPLPETFPSCWRGDDTNPLEHYFWFGRFCGQLGFPVQTGINSDILLLEDGVVDAFCDEEINRILTKTVFLTGDAAARLQKRGFGEFLGARVRDEKIRVDGERIIDAPEWSGKAAGKLLKIINCRLDLKTIVPFSDTRILSWFITNPWYHSPKTANFSPAMTFFRNQLGGAVVLLAASKIKDGFQLYDWINPIRKEQFSALFARINGGKGMLRVKGDYPCFVRHGELEENRRELLSLVNLSHDTMPSIALENVGQVCDIQQLMPDGSCRSVPFQEDSPDAIKISVALELLRPVVFLIHKRR